MFIANTLQKVKDGLVFSAKFELPFVIGKQAMMSQQEEIVNKKIYKNLFFFFMVIIISQFRVSHSKKVLGSTLPSDLGQHVFSVPAQTLAD